MTKILLTSPFPPTDKLLEKSSLLQDHSYEVIIMNSQSDTLGTTFDWLIFLWPIDKLLQPQVNYLTKLLEMNKRVSIICEQKPEILPVKVEYYTSWNNFLVRNFIS